MFPVFIRFHVISTTVPAPAQFGDWMSQLHLMETLVSPMETLITFPKDYSCYIFRKGCRTSLISRVVALLSLEWNGQHNLKNARKPSFYYICGIHYKGTYRYGKCAACILLAVIFFIQSQSYFLYSISKLDRKKLNS